MPGTNGSRRTVDMRERTTRSDPLHRWTTKDALETYGVSAWGRDYFSINKSGNLTVTDGSSQVDVKALVDDLSRRGIQLPILIRFSGLLDARLELLNGAFAKAIDEYDYDSTYQGVYPIKVNQSRKVVESVTKFGRQYAYGLEAGSKPELLAAMAMLDDDRALLICNGYKDDHYIGTALMASRLRGTVVVVVEKASELEQIRRVSEELGIRPTIGIRMRLSTRGSGKWEQSGGDRAKFGLSATGILEAAETLREWGMLDCLKLLHFHIGSQVTTIRSVKDALREASRMYVELVKLGCNELSYVDVGGGLGVDYDGSQTNFDSSMNYTVQEYANDVVWTLQQVCGPENVRRPTIVTESGRAVVAHHSVLVVNVIGVSAAAAMDTPEEPKADDHILVHELWDTYKAVSRKTLRECYHDVLEHREQVLQLFNLGHLSLAQRAVCERLFWASCKRMLDFASRMPRVPEELKVLEQLLCDTLFCNFSMFQSIPDAWAVNQLFPIMPIHRLDEAPSRRAVLADITCDSDGAIDSFVDVRDVKNTLAVHSLNDDPYYLGIMLTGAYQEILGDMHNLFGDTNVVNVSLTENGGYKIDEVVYGDTVSDVLRYVDYEPNALVNQVRDRVEVAVDEGRLTLEQARRLIQRYRDGLASYTYLE